MNRMGRPRFSPPKPRSRRGRAVQLGQHHAGGAGSLAELLGLALMAFWPVMASSTSSTSRLASGLAF